MISEIALAIVIPAYKTTFLRATLESLAQQTDQRFRVYIGDDCSPHDIARIADEFSGRLNILYHRFDSNMGGQDLVGQWKRCIALSSEPYIWLFSDDDIAGKDCVRSFYQYIDRYPDGELFHFNISMIDSLNGGVVIPLPEFPAKLSAGEFLRLKLTGKIQSYVVEFVFSRNIYEKAGGFENFDLAWGSDFMTWLKMAAISAQGMITVNPVGMEGSESKVLWRQSAENISPDNSNPILKRKIVSLIGNARFIKRMFDTQPEALYPLKSSFRWLRFPLGEIFRNRHSLTLSQSFSLITKYFITVFIP